MKTTAFVFCNQIIKKNAKAKIKWKKIVLHMFSEIPWTNQK